ncbi:hypothetical protein V5O48_013591 [Marasmius crinis-equi]|uniref:Uncharacterized protein n=1 Tax=Marasmius crinis-equi TaxID=585013 RepID=A0ABR3EZN1_9AGAR
MGRPRNPDNGRIITADLVLAGDPCNVFGEDIENSRLQVIYETENLNHLKITDPSESRYEVPESVFPGLKPNPPTHPPAPKSFFTYEATPFAFSISRAKMERNLPPSSFPPNTSALKTPLPPPAQTSTASANTPSPSDSPRATCGKGGTSVE